MKTHLPSRMSGMNRKTSGQSGIAGVRFPAGTFAVLALAALATAGARADDDFVVNDHSLSWLMGAEGPADGQTDKYRRSCM